MAKSYKKIFEAPGTIGFSLSAFIARIPNSMVFISLTLMLSNIGYSYSRASYITVTYIAGCALMSPQTARFADIYGQRLCVALGTTITVVSLIALLLFTKLNAPIFVLMVLAFFASFSPNFGALVRARWSRIYGRSTYIRSAFAFESIIDEVVFMVGPVIAIFFTTNIAPQAGVLAAVTFMSVGGICFFMQRKTEPKIENTHKFMSKSVLAYPIVLLVAIILFVFGIIYGAAELSAIAFCKEIGQQSLSALPIVLYAVASFITGFIYGTKHNVAISLTKQLLLSITIAAIATIPFFFITNLSTLCFALFCSGASCAPTLIIAAAIIEANIPNSKITEGISWIMTGLNLGICAGYTFSSPLIDYFGAQSGFYLTSFAGVLSFVIVITTYNILKKYHLENL